MRAPLAPRASTSTWQTIPVACHVEMDPLQRRWPLFSKAIACARLVTSSTSALGLAARVQLALPSGSDLVTVWSALEGPTHLEPVQFGLLQYAYIVRWIPIDHQEGASRGMIAVVLLVFVTLATKQASVMIVLSAITLIF